MPTRPLNISLLQGHGSFVIKRGNLQPQLGISVETTGYLNKITPYELSSSTYSVSAVTFSMIDDCGNYAVLNSAASISCYSGGTIIYNWASGDTDLAGKYQGEFTLLYDGGHKMTLPMIGSIPIYVLDKINNF